MSPNAEILFREDAFLRMQELLKTLVAELEDSKTDES